MGKMKKLLTAASSARILNFYYIVKTKIHRPLGKEVGIKSWVFFSFITTKKGPYCQTFWFYRGIFKQELNLDVIVSSPKCHRDMHI
jgi:hypothetical protein